MGRDALMPSRSSGLLAVPGIASGIVDRLLDKITGESPAVAVVGSLKTLVDIRPSQPGPIRVEEYLGVSASHIRPNERLLRTFQSAPGQAKTDRREG